MKNLAKITTLAMAGAVSLSGAAAHANPAANKTLINQIYGNLSESDWNQLLSVRLASTSQPVVKDGRVEDSQKVVTCTSREVTVGIDNWVTEASLLNPSSVAVWPGSLIYANRQLAEGTPTPMRVDRASARVRINLPGFDAGAGTVAVEDPTNLTVKAAVDDKVAAWLQNEGKSFAPPLQVYSQSEKAYSAQQIGVELGFSGQWASGSASGSMKVNSSSSETVVMKMIKQIYYTAELEMSGGVESYFAPNVTLTSADISKEMPPAVVTSVSYGRVLIAQMRVSELLTEAEAEAAMSYAAGDNKAAGNASVKARNAAKNAKFTVLAIGGGAQDGATQKLLDGDITAFGKAISENYVFSAQSPAKPISYTVASLDGQLRSTNATTKYVEHDCNEYPNRSVELKSTGWYVSAFTVSYMVPNKRGIMIPKVWTSGDKTSPYQSGRMYIPGDAKNISIVGINYTGLVWDKTRKPLNVRGDSLTKQHNCFQISGTTLNPEISRCD